MALTLSWIISQARISLVLGPLLDAKTIFDTTDAGKPFQ